MDLFHRDLSQHADAVEDLAYVRHAGREPDLRACRIGIIALILQRQ